MGRYARYLVAASSLLLALPPHWCCVSPQEPTKTKTLAEIGAATPGETSGGCPFCHMTVSTTRTTGPAPVEQPTTPSNSPCPCGHRHATLASRLSADQAQTRFAFLLPEPDHVLSTLSSVARERVVGRAFPAPPDPLHVRKCVWLC
jgi:hypothetical protein